MPGVRDHEPFVIENFNGWWDRGDNESAPSDHFTTADNIQYFNSGFETRTAIDKYQTSATTLEHILRIYNYVMQSGQSLLVLTTGGRIYHCIGPTTIHGPILTIAEMTDFGFVAYNGRAYITPFKTNVDVNGVNYELGIHNEFLYVYKGDGTAARKAAGNPPLSTSAPISGTGLVVANGAATTTEATDIGLHLLAVVYETDTGYLTALGPQGSLTGPPQFGSHTYDGMHLISVTNIPLPPSDAHIMRRHIVSTKAIIDYNGDQSGYQFFFIPEGNIDDPLVSSTGSLRYFDSDLLSDASHLIDNFAEIPAGVNLNTYHSRLVIVGEYGTTETLTGLPAGITDNRSLARISAPGEPEAISKIDGLIVAPLDGNPLTNCQEFRDVLYLFKRSRTFAYSDNNDEPSTWSEEIVDQGVGCPVHGIATVLDTGGVNVDFLLIADWSGLMIFNGVYARPELSWKIDDYWMAIVRNDFRYIQLVNDSLSKKIYMTLPPPNQHYLLHADYGNGLDAKNIRWARWIFDAKMSCLALIETTKLIIGAVADTVE